MKWAICGFLFVATTINYIDRSAFSLLEPTLHNVGFMGWDAHIDAAHQVVFNNNYGNVLICFQIAYGIGLLTAGRFVDKLGTKLGFAVVIAVWTLASMAHSLVVSVAGFCIARVVLALGEAGNFPAAIKSTAEWFPARERALATGIFNSGTSASAFIAPAVVTAVTLRWGWRAAFLVTGSFGLLWFIAWLLFPYDRLRRKDSEQRSALSAVALPLAVATPAHYADLFRQRNLYGFALAKGLTDPIFYFYLFYLPKFLNETYGLDLKHAYWQIACVYAVTGLGSIAGGALSGWRMRRGDSLNRARKLALLLCACLVVPIVFVPRMGHLFPHTSWPAVMLIALAAAAHQGWSATIFTTAADLFPSAKVSTVVGIGGAVGAGLSAVFTWMVKHYFSLHPLLIFAIAASAYLFAFVVFQLLVPRLGHKSSGGPAAAAAVPEPV